jgi:uncharacterized SAM-binding protein YcdF (DUF218 family)
LISEKQLIGQNVQSVPVRRRLRWWWLLPAALLLALLGYRLWLGALGQYLVQSGEPVHADIVVVLAGDFSGNRIFKGADLVREGYAPKAVISGPLGMYGRSESDLAIADAVKHGYPESYFIPAPNTSKSTRAEAEAIIPLLRKLNARRVDLVTSSFHTRRSGKVYRTLAPDIDFHVVAAPTLYYTPQHWWGNREGQKLFLMEWMKTVAYWFGI